jgi:probable rRNA maturation factor
MLHIDIAFNCPLWQKDLKKVIEQTLKACTKFLKKETDLEVSVVLTDDREIQKLNAEYRGLNKPTNVLSFETKDEEMLGDIVIAYQTLMHEALEEKISFEAHFRHLLIHGFLHLCGFDHLNDEQAELMENTEIAILEKMGITNPYLE